MGDNEKKILNVLKNSALSAHTQMVCISVVKNLSSIKSFKIFVKELQNSKDIIVSSMGKATITFVLHRKFLSKAKTIFSNNIVDINKDVGIITLKCSNEVNITPGVTNFVASLFTLTGVPMYELISTYTDYVIILDEKKTYTTATHIKKVLGC